ncbi:uncharacterized protein LOC141690895 [Apium graveolens]|uniref:uncharacterized protein LOC141690895 n=1 Tax=Apium graveolens TaxID=4045 RepID=UPI003D7AC5C6
MVFLDEKGNKIQATVKQSLIRRFSHLLVAGQCRLINNFGVGQNNENYRASQHPYKINFIFYTSVVRCEDDISIPVHGFKFASFNDILSKKLNDKFLIDIIARVTGYRSLESNLKDNKENKKLIMELEDAEYVT